jgi:hypothetical protein
MPVKIGELKELPDGGVARDILATSKFEVGKVVLLA